MKQPSEKQARVVDLKGLLPIDIRDVLTYAGLMVSGIGGWLYSPPIALVVVGAALFYLGVFHSGKGG